MTDGLRATRNPDWKEADVELELYDHHIPIEELEESNKELQPTLRPPLETEVDPDQPF